MSPLVLGYALFLGILPALIWLYVLLKEDSRCPEPRRAIALAFAIGMIVVPFVLYPQSIAHQRFPEDSGRLYLAYSAIEESAKYLFAALFILWRRSVDETIDYVIYMLTIGLGFAAAENMLFILKTLMEHGVIDSLINVHERFMGATLLHLIASSVIGFALAWSYHRAPIVRIAFASVGLILAIALHTAFNLLIIGNESVGGAHVVPVELYFIWTAALIFFAAFEILKYFRYRNTPTNVC